MAFSFDPVNIPFKATVDAAIKGINTLKEAMMGLGKTMTTVEKAINGEAVDKFGNSLKALDFRMMRAIERLSLMAVMSRNLKLVFDQLFGATSLASKAFESVAEGLMIFTSLSLLAKDNMGLLAAGFVGLAVAIIAFTTAWVQARIKATDASTETTLKMQRTIDAMKDSLQDATAAGKAFGDTFGEMASTKLQLSRAAFENNFKQIRDLKAEMEKLTAVVNDLENKQGLTPAEVRRKLLEAEEAVKYNNMVRGTPFTPLKDVPSVEPTKELEEARNQVGAYTRALEALAKQQNDIVKDAAILKMADQLEQYSTKLKDLNFRLKEILVLNPELEALAGNFQAFADFGVDMTEQQRIDNAVALLRVRKEILTTTLLQNAADAELEAALTIKKRAGLTDDAENATLKRLLEGRTQRGVNKSDATQNVADAMRQLQEAEAPQKFTKAFTVPFTNAIGDAMINGILQGKKGAEILADTLQNLLSNGLNEAMKNFQQGMIDVFKSIAGAGGELLGSALTMVVGVVAGVLGKKASSTDNFERIKSQIESTQAVRGIVAGPTNVAIAAVGENLKRALGGVEQRLDIMIQLMVRGNQAALPFAGSVATP